MGQKIAITGMGIISSIGNNVEENLNSLQSGKHGISDIQLFETRHAGHIKTEKSNCLMNHWLKNWS
jgi:3-oxoacyl-[acyl-carrier-protein] synthase II